MLQLFFQSDKLKTNQFFKDTLIDMKVLQYIRLHTKIVSQRLRIIIFEKCALHMFEMFVYKHTETIEYVKSSLFLSKIEALRANNSRILRIYNFEDIIFTWTQLYERLSNLH